MSSESYGPNYFEKDWRSQSKQLRWEDPDQQYDLDLKVSFLERFFRDRGKVLFVGTAKGFEVRKARERGWEAFGTDFSQYAIEHADSTISQFLKLADSRNLPFEDNSFNVVAGFNTLEHVGAGTPYQITLALRAVSRVAKAGLLFKVGLRHWAVTHCIDPEPIELQPFCFWVRQVECLGKHRFYHAEIGTAPLHAWLIFYHKDLWRAKVNGGADASYWEQQIEEALKKAES